MSTAALASETFTHDEIEPSTPPELQYEALSTPLHLSWEAGEDNTGIADYLVYVNGELFAVVEDLSLLIDYLDSTTDNEIYVVARDVYGNTSDASETIFIAANSLDACYVGNNDSTSTPGFIRILGLNNEFNVSEIRADISMLGDIDTSEPISYQWYAGEEAIPGATSCGIEKYDYQSYFNDKEIHVEVTYTDDGSVTKSVQSQPISAQNFHIFSGAEDGQACFSETPPAPPGCLNPIPPAESYTWRTATEDYASATSSPGALLNITAQEESSQGLLAREGSHVYRFYADGSRYPDPDYAIRTELYHTNWATKYSVGEEFFNSYSFYAPGEEWDPVTQYSILINQWKQYSSGSPAFGIRLSNKGDYKITLESLNPDVNGMLLGEVSPDEWNDVKTYTKFDKGENGVVKVWLNNQLVFDYTGKTMFYESDHGYNTLGMYTEIRDERILYFDAIEMTKSLTTDFDTWLNDRRHRPVITFSGVEDGQQFASGELFSITGVAQDPAGNKLYTGGGISDVKLYDGGLLLMSTTDANYSFADIALADGAHSLRLVAIDTDGNSISSPVLDIWVGNKAPSISLMNEGSVVDYSVGDSVQLSATASDPDGQIVAVEFYANQVFIGRVDNSVDGSYTISWSPDSSGEYHITAVAFDDEREFSVSAHATYVFGDTLTSFETTAVQDASMKPEDTSYTNNSAKVLILGRESDPHYALIEFDLSEYSEVAQVRSAAMLFYVTELNSGSPYTQRYAVYSTTNSSWQEGVSTSSTSPQKVVLLGSTVVSDIDAYASFNVSEYLDSAIKADLSEVTFWVEDAAVDGVREQLWFMGHTLENPPKLTFQSGDLVLSQGFSFDSSVVDLDAYLDLDGDGVMNYEDLCSDTSSSEVADSNGCAPSQRDSDGDGVMNNEDLCSDTSSSEVADSNGCAPSQRDSDGDGWSDKEEIEEGTDPLSASSQPEIQSGLPIWLLYQATQ